MATVGSVTQLTKREPQSNKTPRRAEVDRADDHRDLLSPSQRQEFRGCGWRVDRFAAAHAAKE